MGEIQTQPGAFSTAGLPFSQQTPAPVAAQPISATVKPLVTPMATADSNPLDDAVTASQKKYPVLSKLPIALTKGTGPYESETYEPTDENNPIKGKWNIQLRSKQSMSDPAKLPDTVASESLHALYQSDPRYQAITKAFVGSMTPGQLESAHQMYQRQEAENHDTGGEPFESWLPRVQAQEYIRGYLFPNVNPGWIGPKGEGGYTPLQQRQLENLKRYMRTGR